MAEYISCRFCASESCKGCNMLTLEGMLYQGKFDCLMDGHHTIIPADVVKVKRGENLKPSGMFECSLCGWMDWDTMLADGRFNFCPNCGARMEVDNEAD